MRSGVLLALGYFLLSIGIAQAEQCDAAQSGRARILADAAAQKLVPERFLGGKEITATAKSCDYLADQSLTLGIQIDWSGVFFSWNKYEVWGEVRTNWVGDQMTFLLIGGNDKAQELVFWGQLAGTMIDIGAGRAR